MYNLRTTVAVGPGAKARLGYLDWAISTGLSRLGYLDWAITAREHADLVAAAYLTALAKDCFEDAAALDTAEGKIPATQNVPL
jgi:hypothetical protein